MKWCVSDVPRDKRPAADVALLRWRKVDTWVKQTQTLACWWRGEATACSVLGSSSRRARLDQARQKFGNALAKKTSCYVVPRLGRLLQEINYSSQHVEQSLCWRGQGQSGRAADPWQMTQVESSVGPFSLKWVAGYKKPNHVPGHQSLRRMLKHKAGKDKCRATAFNWWREGGQVI